MNILDELVIDEQFRKLYEAIKERKLLAQRKMRQSATPAYWHGYGDACHEIMKEMTEED